MKHERLYLIATNITQGIITLIESDGSIGYYRQRGIQTLGKQEINREIKSGKLNPNWQKFKQLPDNYSISYEEPKIMGRALATYPAVLLKNRKKHNNGTSKPSKTS